MVAVPPAPILAAMHTYRAGRDRGYIFWIGTLDGHPVVDVGSGALDESIELATCVLAAHFHPRFTVLFGTAGAQNAALMPATWSWAGTRWTNRRATMSSVVTRLPTAAWRSRLPNRRTLAVPSSTDTTTRIPCPVTPQPMGPDPPRTTLCGSTPMRWQRRVKPSPSPRCRKSLTERSLAPKRGGQEDLGLGRHPLRPDAHRHDPRDELHEDA